MVKEKTEAIKPMEIVLKNGVLRTKSGVLKRRKNRMVVLTDCFIKWTKHDAGKVKGSVFLLDIEEVYIVNGHDNKFEICHDGDHIERWTAESPEEAKEWVATIEDARERLNVLTQRMTKGEDARELLSSTSSNPIVDDSRDIVKEVRLDGSHTPLATGDKCAWGKQIDLGTIQPNDCILIKTYSGKEAQVTLEMLEKGNKKLLLFPGLVMEARKLHRLSWMKNTDECAITIATTLVFFGGTCVILTGKKNPKLRFCLGGIVLVSVMACLLLRWALHKTTYWSVSLQAVVGTDHHTPQEVIHSENSGDEQLLKNTELKTSGVHHSEDSNCDLSMLSTPKTLASTSKEFVNEEHSLQSERTLLANHFSSKTKSTRSRRRRMSRKRSGRRLSRSSRKGSKADSLSNSELIDDPRYADIPLRYKVGCLYDMEEARRRWDLTVAWREEEGIDGLIYETFIQDHFETIKEFYPHWICGKSVEGHLVYYEQPGKVNMKALREAGLTVEGMIRYYVFICEVIWRKLDLREDDGKIVTVFDCKGIRFRDLFSEAMKFTKGASAVVQAHYVERCGRIYVVNIPPWFAKVWALVKPLANARTLEKVKIFQHPDKLIEEMKKDVDPKFIPVEYGGEAIFGDGTPGECRWHAPEELEYRRIVKSLSLEAQNNQATNGT